MTVPKAAYAVFSGLMLFLGVLIVAYGGWCLATSTSPRADAETRIDASRKSGTYMPDEERQEMRAEGAFESDTKKSVAFKIIGVGGICLLPFILLTVTRKT